MKRTEKLRIHPFRKAVSRLARYGALLVLLLGACLLFACMPSADSVVISEVVTSNSTFSDDVLGTPDWIELHNTSGSDLNLAGYILTDKEDRYDLQNMLPEQIVPAGGYTVLFAHAGADADAFCLPFGLSKSGDTLFLLDPSGNLIERLAIPALPENVSYARRDDGSFGYCIVPTPGRDNTSEITDQPLPVQTEAPDEERASDLKLYMTEIVSNDAETGRFGGADWIELFNPNGEAVSLDGFYLSDRADKPDKAALPPLTVAANGYAAIPCGTPDGVDLRISSDGETLSLYDPTLALIDRVTVPALPTGQSWAKNGSGAFGYCGAPTPGEPNDSDAIGAEQIRDSGADEPLRLNEVLFRNEYSIVDSYGDHADFAELLNVGAEPVELSEYTLSDDFSDSQKWRLPQGTLAPGEYLLIFLTGKESVSGELHAPFSLSSSDDGLMLYHAPTRTAQKIPQSDGIPKNTSVGLSDDGRLLYYKYPTPGTENAAYVDDSALLGAFPSDDVHISEVSAINAGSDWIELKNGSDASCDLSGWYLCDSLDREPRFPLSGSLDAGSFEVFKPDCFGISVTGETVFLFDANDRLRDAFDTGDQTGGFSSGRTDDPAVSRVFFRKATPGTANGTAAYRGRTSVPVPSDTALYHSEPFSVTLTCADPTAVIRYTLDGSEPDKSAAAYTEPLEITHSVTLRYFAEADGYLPCKTETVTYLFETPHTLPVVSIACDPKDFRAFMRISSQMRNYPHTDAQIAFYEADGTLGTSFPADINPRGNQSIKNPQKSLSLHLRGRLGQGTVNYPFWGDGTALDYGSLILRNGSQDYAKARLRDSFALYAVEELGLDSARTRPVVVYVNGAYYGIMDLNECMNQDYLVTHYGVDPALISHVSTNETVRYGSAQDFLRVRKFAQNKSFASDATVEEFAQWVDVDYIINYVIAQTFFANYDVKNQSYWATSDYTIRWRPVFYDIDRCLTDGSSKRNLFSAYFDRNGVLYDDAAGRVVNMDLYAALRRNPAWCDRFLHRYAYLLQTTFTVDRLDALLDRVAAALRPEMERHIALYHAPSSLSDWEKYVASMHTEIHKRHDEIQNQICTEFRLTRSQWDAIMKDAAPTN